MGNDLEPHFPEPGFEPNKVIPDRRRWRNDAHVSGREQGEKPFPNQKTSLSGEIREKIIDRVIPCAIRKTPGIAVTAYPLIVEIDRGAIGKIIMADKNGRSARIQDIQ
ncbi:MAG: hypothetical protein PHZ14_08305 [Sulfuricella sp.]|nr:hypothetical protein [Sulfuricella sp.]